MVNFKVKDWGTFKKCLQVSLCLFVYRCERQRDGVRVRCCEKGFGWQQDCNNISRFYRTGHFHTHIYADTAPKTPTMPHCQACHNYIENLITYMIFEIFIISSYFIWSFLRFLFSLQHFSWWLLMVHMLFCWVCNLENIRERSWEKKVVGDKLTLHRLWCKSWIGFQLNVLRKHMSVSH